jgi:hypothetical protein
MSLEKVLLKEALHLEMLFAMVQYTTSWTRFRVHLLDACAVWNGE